MRQSGMKARDVMWIALASELAASTSLLGMGPRLLSEQSLGGWALALVATLLGVLAMGRMAQVLALNASDPAPWRGKLALGFGASLLGWLGLIVLFAMRIICPEVEVHLAFYIAAFATHIVGTLIALRQLGHI